MSDLVDTPVGPARVTVTGAGACLVVLGHGAGGSSWSKDVLAVRDRCQERGWTVALVDQPWRVAGRKVADRPPVLDRAWVPVVDHLRTLLRPEVLVVGGRSAGARVACRTATAVAADAVLCVSFPLHPPGRPASSRADELALPVAAGLPVRVVQGARDPFGTPEEVRSVLPAADGVIEVPGTHSLSSPSAVADAITAWIGDRESSAPGRC